MEQLTNTVQNAVQTHDYQTLHAIFREDGPSSWQVMLGPGEQRSLAAVLIVATVQSPDFVTKALQECSDDMIRVLTTALSHLPANIDKAADNVLRQQLFTHLVQSGDDYAGAARILGGMRMEQDDPNSVYYMKAAEICDVYVKIAECFLAEDEIAESDAAVNKAGMVVEAIPDKERHMALILRYKSTYARVLDANRKFLQASQRYHELSQTATDLIDADELLQMLGMAVTCAILAPSGPQRQRVLGSLYNDTRLQQLDGLADFATHSTILKKMYLRQILRPHELVQFESSLAAHQKAIMGDGLTIMERGVVEHNMVAVSRLYRTIYVTELARILGVSSSKAEKVAASMIMDGSLHGSMDQVEGVLQFVPLQSPEQIRDQSITDFCMDLNRVVTIIKKIPKSL